MNILKTLFTMFVVLVIAKMILDFLCIGSNNIMEGMENKKKEEKNEEKEQIPNANPHMAQNSSKNVPDDSVNHKYKKYVPSNLDELPVKAKQYEEIGRDFLKDEAKKRKKHSPKLGNRDAEVLGKMVWRTYVAEMDQKRKNSPKAKDEVMSREIQLMNKVSEIMKSESDHHKGKGKKHHSVANQASSVSSRCSPKDHKSHHTTNMFTHIPKSGNDIEREHGYAFKGKPIHGTPKYYELSNAIEHCSRDRACGGVNYDSTTGYYTLMPLHAKLEKRPHYTAFIKKQHHHTHNAHHKHQHKRHTHPTTGNDYLPVTGIGSLMSPNTLPRPFNSLYAIY
jgi:hypothetical protein